MSGEVLIVEVGQLSPVTVMSVHGVQLARAIEGCGGGDRCVVAGCDVPVDDLLIA